MTSPAHEFNPYHTWLGLDPSVTQPDHFQLLGISPQQRDAQHIAAAAQRAAARVRGFRPGNRSAQWAALLDEIHAARICLSDPAKRADYERRLAAAGGVASKGFHRPAPRTASTGPAAATGRAPLQPRAVPMSAPPSRPASSSAATPTAGQGHVPTAIPLGSTTSRGAPAAAGPATGFPLRADKPTSVVAARRRRRSIATPAAIAAAACLMLAVGVLLLVMALNQPSEPKQRAAPVPEARSRPAVGPRQESSRPGRSSPKEVPQQADADRLGPVVSEFPPRKRETVAADQPADDNQEAAGLAAPIAEDDRETWKPPEFPELDTSLRSSDTGLPPAVPQRPAAEPDPEAVRTLMAGLESARQAACDQKFDAALDQLNRLASAPKTPEHQALYDRLDLLTQYAKNFRSALAQASAALEPGDEIEVGAGRLVGVVEVLPDMIKIRSQGTNRTWRIDELPPGLAVAIADTWLREDDPVGLVMKGAYLVARKNPTADELAKARSWWQEAASAGFDLGDLPQVIDDSYHLPTIEKR